VELARHLRMAEDTHTRYHADALISDLALDCHAEEIAVAAFSKGINLSRLSFLEDPLWVPLISNWNRMIAAIPDPLSLPNAAVEANNH